MSNSKLMPVIVQKVKLSEKTSKLTGATSFSDLLLIKPNLFTKLSDADLLNVLEDIYNGKLTGANLAAVKEMSVEEKRNHAIETLSLQLELVQEMPRVGGQPTLNAMGLFMSARKNVSNQTSLKYAWQTITLSATEQFGYTDGCNFSEIMESNGFFVYLQRMNSFTPEVRDNRIVSSPKRAGAGGDILIKDEKLIFNNTKFILDTVKDGETYESKYDALLAVEIANAEEFKHDSVIDLVNNPNIPHEARDKKTGFFNDEFQKWLNDYYADSTGIQVSIEAGVTA